MNGQCFSVPGADGDAASQNDKESILLHLLRVAAEL